MSTTNSFIDKNEDNHRYVLARVNIIIQGRKFLCINFVLPERKFILALKMNKLL